MKTIKQLLRLYEGGGIFTAIDTETTGLFNKSDRIIEIGAVKFCKDGVIDKFSTLINPQMPIPYASTKVNGITNQMVCDCPTFFEIHHDFSPRCYYASKLTKLYYHKKSALST